MGRLLQKKPLFFHFLFLAFIPNIPLPIYMCFLIWSIQLVLGLTLGSVSSIFVRSIFLDTLSSFIPITCPNHINLLYWMSFFYFTSPRFQSYVRNNDILFGQTTWHKIPFFFNFKYLVVKLSLKLNIKVHSSCKTWRNCRWRQKNGNNKLVHLNLTHDLLVNTNNNNNKLVPNFPSEDIWIAFFLGKILVEEEEIEPRYIWFNGLISWSLLLGDRTGQTDAL